MPTLGLLYQPIQTPLDASGELVPSGSVLVQLAGTSTASTIYDSSGAVISTAGVVTADSTGRFPAMFLDVSLTYKITFRDSSGAALPDYPVDNVTVGGGGGSGGGGGFDLIQIEALVG
jgi:hypothetical protein